MKKLITILFALTLTSQVAFADLCGQWSQPRGIGEWDSRTLEEVSGIAFSRKYPDRVYSHNDSGAGASFFISSTNGSKVQEVQITGVGAFDVEDIGYGPCGNSTCIYVADIGDNFTMRSSISISMVVEQPTFGRSAQAAKVLELRYPDGAHNAEAMAVHPNGDVFIVTKEKSGPAQIYKAPRATVAFARGAAPLQHVGSIDTRTILGDNGKRAIVTGMDIAADGKKFILMTYLHAIEFNVDLSATASFPRHVVAGKDYSVAQLSVLQQQEAIAYLPDASGFIYTTELGDGSRQPIEEVTCLTRPARWRRWR